MVDILMTDTPPTDEQVDTNPNPPPAPEQPNTLDGITQEQWQEFMGTLVAQNAALQNQVNTMAATNVQRAANERQSEINSMPDKERADALQGELDQIRQAGASAQAQSISNSVWQRRDADAAARLLSLHGFNGTEPELYRGNWDVNWMPRFVASVEGLVKNRNQSQKNNSTNPSTNPANRANVGNSTSSALPELDPNASGFDTIRFALARGKQ